MSAQLLGFGVVRQRSDDSESLRQEKGAAGKGGGKNGEGNGDGGRAAKNGYSGRCACLSPTMKRASGALWRHWWNDAGMRLSKLSVPAGKRSRHTAASSRTS